MTQFFLSVHREKKSSHFDINSWVEFWFRQLLRSKLLNFFSLCTKRKKIDSFWPKKLSHLSWDETKKFKLKKKIIVLHGYPAGNGQSSIIAKAVNKQNASKLLPYKLYFKKILKMILKSFDF